jgi:predicted PhzF superfamily epimerase YddE/YHI9
MSAPAAPHPHRYHVIDVFGRTPYRGNPLAVVHGAQGWSPAQMQAFAAWTNLSETTYLLPPSDPQADYRVRIFTPGGEMPFAGHPTLGSAWAWRLAGGQPARPGQIVQECGVGLVQLREHGAFVPPASRQHVSGQHVSGQPASGQPTSGQLSFAAPPLRRASVEDALLQAMLAALGLPRDAVRAAQDLVNGPRWVSLLLDSAERVRACRPDFAALARLPHVGLVGPTGATEADAAQFEVRGFAPEAGINEDPVTGSLNAALAQWLMAEGLAPASYRASQGTCVGRDGRVSLDRDGAGKVWVGGACVACVEGLVQGMA